jgi:hypothetical protein
MAILASLASGLKLTDYTDWLTFVERLNDATKTGAARKTSVLKYLWDASEEWYVDSQNGDVYVYLPPNPPIMPKWRKLNVLEHLEAPKPTPLGGIKVGPISPMTAYIMKMSLQNLIKQGLVDEVRPPSWTLSSKDITETWYRDNVSRVVYRLIEHYGLCDADDIRWEVVPQGELSGKAQ